jgi:hypothetical protein
MIVRALDTDGDWLFGKGKNDYKTANKAIEQEIRTRVLSFLGDCFFDVGAGIDWFTFLGGSKNTIVVNLAVSTVILNTSGVTGILQLLTSLNPVTRILTLQYAVTTIYSSVQSQFAFDLNGLN